MSKGLNYLWYVDFVRLEDMVEEFIDHRNKTRLDDDKLKTVEDCLRLLLEESKVREDYD